MQFALSAQLIEGLWVFTGKRRECQWPTCNYSVVFSGEVGNKIPEDSLPRRGRAGAGKQRDFSKPVKRLRSREDR